MRYVKLIGVYLTMIFGACVMAASASAAEDIYKVEGVKLEAGETVGIVASAKTEFVLKGEKTVLFITVKSVTRCKKLKLDEGLSPEVVGGTPGTSANEQIEFEECTGEIEGKKCESVVIENAEMVNELVTIVKPEALKGKLATLFKPASGKVFTKVTFKGCPTFGEQAMEVEGSTAAATSAEGVFEPEGEWAWNEKEEITQIEKHNGTKESVGLKANGKPAKLQGVANVAQWVFARNVDQGNPGEAAGTGTRECKFLVAGETCKIEFSTTRAGVWVRIEGKVLGDNPGVRYNELARGCTLFKALPCTDEVEAKKIERPSTNSYCLVAEDKTIGASARTPGCAELKMP